MLMRLGLLSLMLLAFGLATDGGVAADKDKPSADEKRRRDEIDKLIQQLNAEDFKRREEATRQLMKRDDALAALEKAAKSDDAEASRRAQKAVEVIKKRQGKRAIDRAIAKLKKGQTDQFVDAVVQWREYADEDCWKAALEHAQAIADKAGKLSGRKYKALPEVELAKMKFTHSDQLKLKAQEIFEKQRLVAEGMHLPDGIVRNDFLICRRAVKLEKTNLGRSVVFVNGDLRLGTADDGGMLVSCIVVCAGDVTVTADVAKSVILAAGTVHVGGCVHDSVILGGGDVKVGMDLVPGLNFQGVVLKNSVIQRQQDNPLNFIHFFDLAELGIAVKASRQQVLVQEIAAGKCCAQAGVRKGDRILAVDGVKVVSVEDLRRVLRWRMQEPELIRLEIRREDKPLRLDVRLSGETP